MNYVLILAGGTGSRAGGPLPKQFQDIRGKRMIWWSVDAFREFDPESRIILVVHPRYLDNWDNLCTPEELESYGRLLKVPGGKSRIESVLNGLRAIKESCNVGEGDEHLSEAKVFIHDAARPFVSASLIERGSRIAAPGVGGVPGVPLSDSIRKLSLKTTDSASDAAAGGKTDTLPIENSEAVNRADYIAVQTPQVFLYDDILHAYENLEDETGLTDDASVAERSGIRIRVFEGDSANKKITNPSDFGA